MRSKKQGAELELSVMASFSRVLNQLPPESRNRVVNWVSSQDWQAQPTTAPVQTSSATLS
jgi:hypothetical protein